MLEFGVRRKIILAGMSLLLLCAVLTANYPCLGRVICYSLSRGFIQADFAQEFKDYIMLESEGVKVYYKLCNCDSACTVCDAAQESLDRLLEDFDYKPQEKIKIVIYPEYEKMAKMMLLGTGSPALGAYYCGAIGIYDPDGTTILKPGRQGLVLHEMTHYMLDYMSGGNIPAWFTEGTALYEEYKACGTEWAKDIHYESYYSMEELEGNLYSLDEVKAYKQSFLIIKYIGENFGSDVINKTVNLLRTGKTVGQAFHDVTGKDIGQVSAAALR